MSRRSSSGANAGERTAPARRRCHRDAGGIDEVGALGSREVELDAELVRAPEVVVVQERDPGMRRPLDAAVARVRHAAAARVAQHGHARVAERLERLGRAVARAVVDDDDLELDAPLGERQAHRADDDARRGRASG